ncbi:TetR/AcrR family transcriptional regulator [Kitasatospora sp. NPDC056327]|uniref:TetR/AcrR family transcriptional regulator n=1 Tax=Kitasatospora sp. NPDC056327 TaxID=3345785 RepID=UPI0035E0AA19
MGLREEKKRRTRALLADTATALFTEHGFERVTVADVARAAGVAVTTVFNYFPTKEDLFFDRQDEVVDRLARVVRERPAGDSPVDAVRAELLAGLDAGEPTYGLDPRAAAFWRTVEDSPALRARLLDLGERAEEALAAALAEEAGAPAGDPSARVVAGALAGAHRAALAEVRRGVVAGEPVAAVRARAGEAVTAGFGLLAGGLAGWPPARRD